MPRLSNLLVFLGLCAALVALVTGFTRHALLDADEFGDRTVEAIRAEPVRTALASEFADTLINRNPRLLAARPALISATSGLLDSGAAGGLLSRSATQLHRALLTADEPSVVLDLADLVVVVRAFLESTGSDAARHVPDDVERLSVEVATGQLTSDTIQVTRRVSKAGLIAPIVALLLLAGALALARDRRRTLLRVGAGLMVIAALGATAYVVASGLVTAANRDAADPALTRAVLNAFLGDFLHWALVLGAAGALLAGAAATLIGDNGAGGPATAVWRRLRRKPATAAGLGARHALMIIAGLLVVLHPLGALTLAASLLGGYLALLGIVGLLRQWSPQGEAGPQRKPHFPLALAAVALTLPVAAGLFVAVGDEPGAVAAPVATSNACNGSPELCDRRLTEITFPATHNSMAAADAGFFNGNHRVGITEQLDMGYRGLLIDALAGKRNENGVVRTDLTGTTEDTVVAQIGEQGLASAQRLAGRVAFGEIAGETGLYLCHVLCELGATPAVEGMREISQWLDRHPREVLLIFIQDEAAAAPIIEALEKSGLSDHAAPLSLGEPLPTLREMIAGGKRAAILAEEDSGDVPWYLDGFRFFQDTPYAFARTGQLREPAACKRNRGQADSPMLLVNHWVESYPPNPRNADVVNRREAVEDRARRCTASFGLKPTLLAIDFAERGDVLGAVRRLNGLEGGQTDAEGPAGGTATDE